MAEHDINMAGAQKRVVSADRPDKERQGSDSESRYQPLPQEAPEKAKDEYDRIFNAATNFRSIPTDAWMAFLFTLVQDYPNILFGANVEHELYYRATLVTLAYLTNILLQGGMLFWICTMVTLPAVREAQNLYASYHTTAYRESGEFDAQGFQDLPDKSETCQIALSSQMFLAAIIFVWASQMFKELRQVQRRFRDLRSLPTLPAGIDSTFMCQKITTGDKHFKKRKFVFCCMNRCTRLAVMLMITIPKVLVSTGLMILGSVWLAASASFNGLILNSLALGFVTEIDELIFKIFLPVRLAHTLGDFFIAMPSPDTSEGEEEQDRKVMRDSYRRSAIFLFAVLVYTIVFVMFQPVVPRFAWDLQEGCTAYLAQESMPFCKPFETGCFPFPEVAATKL